MKLVKTLLLTLAVSLSLVGCSSSGTKTDKILRIAADNDVASLDTNVATDGFSFDVIKTFTEGLLEYDAAGKIQPAAASSYDVSTDGKTYTFHLRTDAVWSNGDKVTANDFVFSWRRLVDPAKANEYAYMAGAIKIANADKIMASELTTDKLGVVAKDDSTLVVTLEESVPYFLQLMTFPVFHPLNEKFVTAQGANYATSPATLISNGPFILTEWTQGTLITLAKNDKYYGKSKIKLDGIEFHIIKDYQTAALEFEKGSLDVVKLSSDLVDRYKTNAAFTQLKLGYTWYLDPNFTVKELQNKNLRLAIATGFDKAQIANVILADGSMVADYIVPAGLATGPDGKDFRATSPTFLSYDVAKAKAYWEKAKTELGITTLTLDLLVDDAEDTSKVAQFLQSELQANLPGLTITISTTPKKNRLALMREGTFQIGLTRWGPDYADPFTYLGDLFTTGTSYNYGKFSDPAYDAIMKTVAPGGSLSTNLPDRWTALKAAEKLLLEQAAIMPAWQSGEARLINTKVKGIEYHVVGQASYRNVVKG